MAYIPEIFYGTLSNSLQFLHSASAFRSDKGTHSYHIQYNTVYRNTAEDITIQRKVSFFLFILDILCGIRKWEIALRHGFFRGELSKTNFLMNFINLIRLWIILGYDENNIFTKPCAFCGNGTAITNGIFVHKQHAQIYNIS